MNISKLACLVLFSGSLSACAPHPATREAGPHDQLALRYDVAPGAVETLSNPATNSLITGSVTLKRNPDSGDVSSAGGGCLVYRSAHMTGGACNTHADCKFPVLLPNSNIPVAEMGGYCADVPGRPGQNYCWYQPTEASCVKRPGPPITESLVENVVLRFDSPTKAIPSGIQAPVYWRVATCQNIEPFGCATGGEVRMKFGQALLLPMAPEKRPGSAIRLDSTDAQPSRFRACRQSNRHPRICPEFCDSSVPD